MKFLPSAGYEVPDRYEKDLFHLMVKDAHSLYVYWEVGNRRRWLVSQHFECDYGAMPKVLRIYDVTGTYFNGSNAHSWFDMTVSPEANNWYIHGLAADRTYVADLGTYTIEHEFIPLLRSNCAATPKDAEAAWGEPLQSVVAELADGQAHGRIMPHFFENIQAYSPCSR